MTTQGILMPLTRVVEKLELIEKIQWEIIHSMIKVVVRLLHIKKMVIVSKFMTKVAGKK